MATLPGLGHDTGAGHDALAGQTGLAGHAGLLATTSALAMQTELAEPPGLLPHIALPECGELAGRAASPGLAKPAVPPEARLAARAHRIRRADRRADRVGKIDVADRTHRAARVRRDE
jgi:hypothetical protein